MAVKKAARAPKSPAEATGSETVATAAQIGPEPRRPGRKLTPSEHAVLEAMIAEAEAMRLRLNAGR